MFFVTVTRVKGRELRKIAAMELQRRKTYQRPTRRCFSGRTERKGVSGLEGPIHMEAYHIE